jgi:hypothetical protein
MTKSNAKEIGSCRSVVLDAVANRTISMGKHLELLNSRYANRTLSKPLMKAISGAWERPRERLLTESTIYQWAINSVRRGHHRPLKRQKDYAVYPWHELAFMLKQRHPKMKISELYKTMSLKYPEVSIHRLRAYFRFISAEMKDTCL